LEEQRRIVALLDRAGEIRRRAEAARAIIPAVFLDTFGDPATNSRGWPIVEVEDLVERIDGGWSPTCGDGVPQRDQWGVLKLSAVRAGGFDSNEAKLFPNQSEIRPELEVQDGDLLFTRKNTLDLVGTSTVVNNSPRGRMLPDTIFRLVPAEPAGFNAQYFAKLINFNTFRPIIRQLASGSAASMPGISKSRLRKLKIPLPPLALQTDFAEQVERIEALARNLNAAAAKAEATVAALSAEVFE
jgi:type I restriction enzyme S subunit